MKEHQYTEWSAGVMVAVVDTVVGHRWWNDELKSDDREYAREHLPRFDINQRRWIVKAPYAPRSSS